MSTCCNHEKRREAVRALDGWNGIDFVEVSPDQRSLTVYFLGKLPQELRTNQPGLERYIAVEGGERIRDIHIVDVDPFVDPDPEKDDYLVVALDRAGDFSTYTLRLQGVERVDPRYESADFSFKIDCPSDLDCASPCESAPEAPADPEINYLAKDYASFRQLILDRMSLNVPGWTERHVPDLGVALVEALAYEADFLSYYQDAVATEAYLNTARQRISVRRHARLVDYRLHEGCNARAFVAIESDTALDLHPSQLSFLTGLNAAVDKRTVVTWDDLREVPASAYEAFEPLDRETLLKLNPAHNEIHFHTWGNRECCIEKGATSAALVDTGLTLAVGDWLIVEEVRGPKTGIAGDADPSHRHVLRLTSVTKAQDPVVLNSGKPLPYLWVEWSVEDALPFSVCVSGIGAAPACHFMDHLSVARGNVVLVDHGRSTGPEDLGVVAEASTEAECVCEGRAGEVQRIPGRFAPHLSKSPVTFLQPLTGDESASKVLSQDPRQALPQIWLSSEPSANWQPRYDLIASSANDAHYVGEMDNDGALHLRFGDGELGRKPAAGMAFQARYRTGIGTRGNVGPESISLLVLNGLHLSGANIRIRNPLAAAGGIDAEPMAESKLYAPHAFRNWIERAIVAEDYDVICERNSKVQQASTELVWTGSWYEADVAVDPLGRGRPQAGLLKEVETHLEPYRRMGHDLHIQAAVYVPVDLAIEVCAKPGYQAAHLRAALLDVLSSRVLPGGKKGFFHPDRRTFGESLYISELVAAVHAVAGVECATVTKLQRLFEPPNQELGKGLLPLGSHEIAELDGHPNRPGSGRLVVEVHGGRQ